MNEEVELCIICYSELDCSGSVTYSLPECNHKFHQNCIMHWFRQANSKCPLCNNTGPLSSAGEGPARWKYPFERFKVLRRLSRKKDAPKDLVKGIELFINNKDLKEKAGRHAIENIEKCFSQDRMVSSYLDLYHEVIRKRAVERKVQSFVR